MRMRIGALEIIWHDSDVGSDGGSSEEVARQRDNRDRPATINHLMGRHAQHRMQTSPVLLSHDRQALQPVQRVVIHMLLNVYANACAEHFERILRHIQA
jgi:hypothetical protein